LNGLDYESAIEHSKQACQRFNDGLVGPGRDAAIVETNPGDLYALVRISALGTEAEHPNLLTDLLALLHEFSTCGFLMRLESRAADGWMEYEVGLWLVAEGRRLAVES
jgi:hypothetical protein